MATNMLTMILSNCGDIFFFDRFSRIFCYHSIKKLAEIVYHTKYFSNFGFGDR